MATISKTPSATWKAVIRKRGWPNIKTFRTKRDAEAWAHRTEDEMVRGVYIRARRLRSHPAKAWSGSLPARGVLYQKQSTHSAEKHKGQRH